MRIAVFSDIHANLPALDAVLGELDRIAPDMVFCLGDLVGYAPWPNEVVAAIRRRGIPTIAGNYDEGVGLHSDDCGCAYRSEEDRARGSRSIAFTNGVISEENRRYLRMLPRQMRIELGSGASRTTILMVHGSPRRINEYLFEDRPDGSFERMMLDAGADVMLFGHTHKPFTKLIFCEDGRLRRVVNSGSVGKPKDGDTRACVALLEIGDRDGVVDAASIEVSFLRIPYDVERAARAVEESPLPSEFAEMLRHAT